MAKPAKVVILGDASDAARALKQIRDEAGQTETRLSRVGKKMETAGRNMTRRVTAPLLGAAGGALKLLEAQEKAEAQLESVLRSTGGAANVTADHVKDLASSLQEVTTFGDEATIAGANLLLTFKNIRNEAGENNDIFDQTVRITQDVATAMGMDLNSAALQVGKALNDPITGLSMLTRVGITFTDEQKNIIQALQESGDMMGAQRIILQELESQFGGSAQAMADTTSGQLKQAMNDLGDAGEQIGAIIAPIATEVADMLKGVAAGFQELSPETQDMIVKMGGVAAAVGPVLFVGGKLIQSFGRMRVSAGKLVGALGTPLTGALAVAAGLVAAYALEQQAARERQEEWTEAIKGTRGELDAFTDDLLVNALAQPGMQQALEETGLTIHDIREAIMGSDEAFNEVNNTLRGHDSILKAVLGPTGSLHEGSEQLAEFIDTQRGARLAAEEFIETEEDLEGQLDGTKRAFSDVMAGGIMPYMEGADDAAESTDDLTEATKSLAEEQQALVDPLFNLRRRTEDLTDAQQNYIDVVAEHGPNSQEAEDAAWDLADAQLNANAAAQRYADEGGPDSVEALRNLLAEAGLAEEAILRIIDSIHTLNQTTITPKALPTTPAGVDAFDSGGVVPGPRGAPRLILAHGGETVLPTHKESPSVAVAGTQEIQFINYGTLVGVDDVDTWIQSSLARARKRGVTVA